jgi:23S rRNA pseudouridine1911/1915/1917 synthase
MRAREEEFIAEEYQARLDEFLACLIPDLSLTYIRRAVRDGAVLVNGLPTAPGAQLIPGDCVRLLVNADERTSARPEAIPLDVLYEDSEVIVVNKPCYLLTHPSRTEKSGTLTNALAYHFQQTAQARVRPGIIHRLDRNTSGVIVVAKNARAHRIIAKAFRQRRVQKRYSGLVRGRVNSETGEIHAPIGRDAEAWPRWRVMEEGRPAVTRYSVRRRYDGYTLIEAEPLTGRTHQIRIHFAWIGHPLAGDAVYGVASQEGRTPSLVFPHHLLHASYISFRHPADGREVSFEAPLSPIMQAITNQLEAASGSVVGREGREFA